MDGHVAQDVGSSPLTNYGEERGPCTAILQGGAPGQASHKTNGLPAVREQLREQGISAPGADIIPASWKPGTGKLY